jgi:hypothetical protein
MDPARPVLDPHLKVPPTHQRQILAIPA